MKATFQKIINRTNEIEIGKTYFLSSFYDKDGAMVEIISKSTKLNKGGWPSSVIYKVIQKVGEHSIIDPKYDVYSIGRIGSCNATNLYEKREMADPKNKYKNKL